MYLQSAQWGFDELLRMQLLNPAFLFYLIGILASLRAVQHALKIWTYGENAYPPSKLDLHIGTAAPQSREAVSGSARRYSQSPAGGLPSDLKESV
jgi:hypothetical protein